MNFKIIELENAAVEIKSDKKFSDAEIGELFGKYGKIIKIISNDQNQIIYFSSCIESKTCAANSDNITEIIRKVKSDIDCVGDTISQNRSLNFSKIKKICKTVQTPVINSVENIKEHSTSNRMTDAGHNSGNSAVGAILQKHKIIQKNMTDIKSFSSCDSYISDCSSPVFLNPTDPGFRLAYCHNPNIALNPKVNRLTQFNQSIKKYIDSTPRIGTQELVLTNLPANFKKEDVYKLCGKIEPAEVELKTTSNINILYANVKAKSKDDFDKLTEVLGSSQINGIKITTIPITKITPTTSESVNK